MSYVFVVVCLSLCLLETAQNYGTDLHEIFTEGRKWAIEQPIKFWWRSGSPSGYRDCFQNSTLFGRYAKWYQPTALYDAAVLVRHCHSNYDVITSLALGGGMHCLSASSCNF